MSTHESQLKNDLQTLQESFRELSLRLAETAGNLGRSGRPPSEEVLQQLQGAHQRFRELREAAFQLATGERLTPAVGADQASVPDLLAILRQVDEVRAVRKKNQEQMQKARSVLDRVLSIVHKDSANFAPLSDLQAKAASLREATLADSDQPASPELDNLAEGKHSYCDLLALLEQSEDIDDDRWVQLHESITQAFGKPLAIATTRKKLRLSASPVASGQSPVAREEKSTSSSLATDLPASDPAVASGQWPLANPDAEARRGGDPDAETRRHGDTENRLEAISESGIAVAEENPSLETRNSTQTLVRTTDTQDFTLPTDGQAYHGLTTEPDFRLPDSPPEPLSEQEGSLRRALPEDAWVRSPLTAQQERDILAPANGVAVLFGSRVAGLDEVDRFLHAACREGRLITLDTANDRRGFLRQLDELLKDRPDGLILGVVPDYCPWSEDWVLSSLESIGRLTSRRKFARLLFIADPEATWSWVQTDRGVQDRLVENGVAEFSLEPWSDSALRQWMSAADFGPDDQAGRDCFRNVTGNWASLLHQVGLRCRRNRKGWQEVLVDYERELAQRVEWRELFGLIGQTLPVLKVMAERNEPVNWEDISTRVSGGSPILVAMVLCWADRLRYIRPAGQNKWVLDPIIRQAVLKTDI
jgi:hypothetical protein